MTSKATHSKALWAWVLSAFALTLCGELWLCKPLISAYYPSSDELALETTSTPIGGALRPWRWLSEGFHGFFASYREWDIINSDLWRPLANALFWLHYRVFGAHFSSQLMIGYAVHATVVATIAYIALAVFRMPWVWSLLAILLAALNPALWSPFPSPRALSNMLQFPIFQTEMLCALLMLLAFLAFVQERYGVFALLAVAGACLKETSLTVPLSALLFVAVWRTADAGRSAQRALCLAAPLLVWCVGKFGLFRYGFLSSVLISGKRFGWLTQPIRNLLLWPTGLYVSPLSITRQALHGHDWSTLFVHGSQLLVNFGVWAGLLWVALRRPRWRLWSLAKPEPWRVGLIFALGNLALVIALQSSQLRFGYFWLALGPASLLAALPRNRPALALASALTLGMLIPELVTIERGFSVDSLQHYRRVKAASSQLSALLRALPANVQRVYLVDDILVKPVAPEYLQRFSGFRGEVTLINSLEPVLRCTAGASAGSAPRYRFQRQADESTLEYLSAPDCYQSDWSAIPISLRSQAQVPRGPWLRYELSSSEPERRFRVHARDPACAEASTCLWLGFDAATDRYVAISE